MFSEWEFIEKVRDFNSLLMMNKKYTKEVYSKCLKGPEFEKLDKRLINLLWN